jgi:hypothetical protein
MAEAPVKEVAALSLDNSKEPTANGSSSPAPASDSGSGSFKDQFKAFSKFGDVKSDGKLITLSQSDKWMKQAQVCKYFAIFNQFIIMVIDNLSLDRLLTRKLPQLIPVRDYIKKSKKKS